VQEEGSRKSITLHFINILIKLFTVGAIYFSMNRLDCFACVTTHYKAAAPPVFSSFPHHGSDWEEKKEGPAVPLFSENIFFSGQKMYRNPIWACQRELVMPESSIFQTFLGSLKLNMGVLPSASKPSNVIRRL